MVFVAAGLMCCFYLLYRVVIKPEVFIVCLNERNYWQTLLDTIVGSNATILVTVSTEQHQGIQFGIGYSHKSSHLIIVSSDLHIGGEHR
jgi:hypothetical protein